MRRYSVFFVAIPVAALCVALGFWQVSRLHQRRVHNAQVRASMVPQNLSGRFDYQRQIVVDALSMDGVPAVAIVTPLILPDSSAVLVERGWVRSPDAHTVELDSLNEGVEVQVKGVMLDMGPPVPLVVGVMWPKHLQQVSPATLATIYPYHLAPGMVRRENVSERLRAVPTPALTDGPHLGYAIQWFSFAVITLVGSYFIFRGDRARGTATKA